MENKHVSLNESLLKDDEDKDDDGKQDLFDFHPSEESEEDSSKSVHLSSEDREEEEIDLKANDHYK